MSQKSYVMIGHSHIVGDLIEIIQANGGVLTKIVQNVEEVLSKNRPSLKQRLERLEDGDFNKNQVNNFYPITIQKLGDFVPKKDEEYVIGFTGFKMFNLVQYLTQKFGIRFTPLIHPSAIIDSNVDIPTGITIQAGVVIGSGVTLEAHAFINKGVKIGSNTTIQSFASLAPGVIIGRSVLIETGAILGIGSVILDELVVHKYSMVAGGAIVDEDVPFNTLVAGVPAVVKKSNLHQTVLPNQ